MVRKHVALYKPPKSESSYKNFFFIVLMVIVYTGHKFTWVDVGAQESISDAQIFHHVKNNWLHIPDADPLPQANCDLLYHFVADDAFALRTWCMKPYSIRHMSREGSSTTTSPESVSG